MQDDVYVTVDFGSVVFLLCKDMSLAGAKRIGDTKVEFHFGGRAECEALVAGMAFNDKVSLSRALHEIRRARAVIHATE